MPWGSSRRRSARVGSGRLRESAVGAPPAPMADDLLDRILGEVRARKEAARAAYEESLLLEAALDALGPPAPERVSGGGRTDVSSPSSRPQGGDEPHRAFGSATPGGATPDLGEDDPGRTEEPSGPTEGTPEDFKPGAGPGADADGADDG